MLKVQVSADENLKAVIFGYIEEFAILKLRPATLVRRRYFMVRQRLTQRDWSALVEKYSHSD